MSNKKQVVLKGMSIVVTAEQKDFLTNRIIHEDAAHNLSEAVQWCIDSCMRIEEKYGIDACYIAFNDIRLKENQP